MAMLVTSAIRMWWAVRLVPPLVGVMCPSSWGGASVAPTVSGIRSAPLCSGVAGPSGRGALAHRVGHTGLWMLVLASPPPGRGVGPMRGFLLVVMRYSASWSCRVRAGYFAILGLGPVACVQGFGSSRRLDLARACGVLTNS